MPRQFFRLAAWLALLGWGAVLPAAAIPPVVLHVDDPSGMLKADRLGAIDLESRLLEYEAKSGIRILVQFHAKSPPAAEDQVPGAYMRALAERLGTRQRGVLVVYFADDPDWRIWIGDDLAAQFAGKSGTVAELTASKAIHDVKEALLASARAKAEAAYAALPQSPGRLPPCGLSWKRTRCSTR